MEFFTPSLVRKSQSARFTSRDWLSVESSYRSHLAELWPAIPRSVRLLSRHYFHDCTILRIEFVEPDTVSIWLKGFKNFRSGKKSVPGIHRITFKRVAQTNLGLEHLSACWSYEEIDWEDNAAELRVLLSDGKQFFLRFRVVTVETNRE
jgi:hypothetical protein